MTDFQAFQYKMEFVSIVRKKIQGNWKSLLKIKDSAISKRDFDDGISKILMNDRLILFLSGR